MFIFLYLILTYYNIIRKYDITTQTQIWLVFTMYNKYVTNGLSTNDGHLLNTSYYTSIVHTLMPYLPEFSY